MSTHRAQRPKYCWWWPTVCVTLHITCANTSNSGRLLLCYVLLHSVTKTRRQSTGTHPGLDVGADGLVFLQRRFHLRRVVAEVLVGQDGDHVWQPRLAQRRFALKLLCQLRQPLLPETIQMPYSNHCKTFSFFCAHSKCTTLTMFCIHNTKATPLPCHVLPFHVGGRGGSEVAGGPRGEVPIERLHMHTDAATRWRCVKRFWNVKPYFQWQKREYTYTTPPTHRLRFLQQLLCVSPHLIISSLSASSLSCSAFSRKFQARSMSLTVFPSGGTK